MGAGIIGEGAATRALARSVVYRFLANGFIYPDVASDGTLRELGGALEEALALAHPALADACAEDAGVIIESLAGEQRLGEYVGLFGHAVRGPIPLYETEYGPGRGDGALLQAHEMADISGFYRAVGLRPRAEVREREDHVAFQCELLQVLSRKEAHAEETGDRDQAAATREVAGAFLAAHLGRFGPGVFRRLGSEAGFYGAVGRLAERFLAAELASAGLPADGEALGLRMALAGPDDEFQCAPAPAASGPPEAMEV